ncbi:MAG: DUF1043 family protein [Gammaproteobacteria bacterium]|nr:DUF1043 family protein [Pseudomonadales bacterium]MCP5345542.1 DUF1043 family protein [Pseudomonadales bacterium]
MVWLIAIGCLALGIIVGVLSANRLSGTPTRIKELEGQVKGLEERHDQYKDDVSEHFNVTADLVQQLTQSYRDVYQHLATGAQDLCTAEVANKLLPAGADAVFDTASQRDEALDFTPPKDYATKQSPDQKGALSEEFGIEKTSAADESEQPVAGSDTDEEQQEAAENAGSEWQAGDSQAVADESDEQVADEQSTEEQDAETAASSDDIEEFDLEEDEDEDEDERLKQAADPEDEQADDTEVGEDDEQDQDDDQDADETTDDQDEASDDESEEEKKSRYGLSDDK